MSLPRLAPRKEEPIFWRDSNLPFEARQAFDCRACYREHTHPTLSIGIVDHGRSLFSRRGQLQEMEAGDVVIIWPKEVHACNPQPSSRWSYRMFYFDWDWVQSALLNGKNFTAPSALHSLIRTPEAVRLVNQMTSILVQPGSSAEKIRRMQTCLVNLPSLMNRPTSGLARPTLRRESAEMQRARQHIEAHADESIDLQSLAKEAGMTPFQFIRKFGREIGLTPHAYLLDQRIIRARELLKGSRSLIEVAYRLGFSDQSHFQRAFKRRVAATPGQYRRSKPA